MTELPYGRGGAANQGKTRDRRRRPRQPARGTLLFTGGGYALHPSKKFASLSVGKAGLRAYVQMLHDQLAGTGVHATSITITAMIGGAPRFEPAEIAKDTSNWRIGGDRVAARVGLLRLPCLLPAARLDWVLLGSLGVGAAAGGGPLVPAGFGLGDVPAARLLDPMAFAASGPGVARAGASALVVRGPHARSLIPLRGGCRAGTCTCGRGSGRGGGGSRWAGRRGTRGGGRSRTSGSARGRG